MEIKDPSIKQIVLLGQTGHGKSTLANRLCNDESEFGDQSFFTVSDDVKSETQEINKQVITNNIINQDISVVDTAGFGDSNNNDRDHCNNLIEFLRGCGGVNAFVIVKMVKPPRFDNHYQSMLKQLEYMLGRAVWKHIVLAITLVNDAKIKKNFGEWSKNLVIELRKEMKLNEYEAPLPVVGFDNLNDYQDGIGKLLKDLVPEIKYQCNELRSPLDMLILQMNNKKMSYDQISHIVEKIYNELQALEQGINAAMERYNSLVE